MAVLATVGGGWWWVVVPDGEVGGDDVLGLLLLLGRPNGFGGGVRGLGAASGRGSQYLLEELLYAGLLVALQDQLELPLLLAPPPPR